MARLRSPMSSCSASLIWVMISFRASPSPSLVALHGAFFKTSSTFHFLKKWISENKAIYCLATSSFPHPLDTADLAVEGIGQYWATPRDLRNITVPFCAIQIYGGVRFKAQVKGLDGDQMRPLNDVFDKSRVKFNSLRWTFFEGGGSARIFCIGPVFFWPESMKRRVVLIRFVPNSKEFVLQGIDEYWDAIWDWRFHFLTLAHVTSAGLTKEVEFWSESRDTIIRENMKGDQ